jgi:alkylation response protein AidB-like acyl-CoA dehydrogenase
LNFDFTDDQQAIKRTAKDFLASRYKAEKVRELAESGTYDDGLWGEISELGWPGIYIPEEYGGQGLGVVELVIVMEELGYALAPSPFFSNAAAGLAILHGGSEDQKQRWLPGIASGEQRGTVAVVSGGEAPLVPDADSASVIVLIDGDTAALVEAGDAEIEERAVIDSTRRFSSVRAEGGDTLGGDFSAGIDRAEAALSAELVGVGQRVMEMAVEYAKDRKQFDRPIGSYQAVSHRCAEMLLWVESARSAAYYAGWASDFEPESAAIAASVAKAYAADAGWKVTASALQVHGGIGFTWEHDLHFFLKRGKVNAVTFGDAKWHRDRVADAVLSKSAEPVPA